MCKVLCANDERLKNACGEAPPRRQYASTAKDKSKPGNNAMGGYQAAAIMPKR